MPEAVRELEFSLVTEQSELYSIAQDWHRLLDESACPEPMMDPSWLLNWWRHYGAGEELAVGLLFDNDRLVGLAPLCIRKYVYRPGLVFRRLQFMGIDANEKDGVCSEYMGFIALPGYEEAVARSFVDNIVSGRFGNWHEVLLGAMNSDQATMALARVNFARHGLRCDDRKIMNGYYIKLPETMDAYLQSISSSRRYRIKNSLSRFEEWAAERGGWRLERAVTPDQLEAGLAILKELHQERWNNEGNEGAFYSPRFVAFHRDYILSRAGSGNVEIAWLVVGNSPVAAIYVVRNGKKVLAYQYGRAIGMPNRVRVGIVMNALMIKAAIERCDEEFDFLGGDSRYKVDFATGARRIVSIRTARPCLHEFVRLGLIKVRDAARAVLNARRAELFKHRIPSAGGSVTHAPN